MDSPASFEATGFGTTQEMLVDFQVALVCDDNDVTGGGLAAIAAVASVAL